MTKDTVYLYADGCDLQDSEAALTAAFAKLASQCAQPSLLLVNDRKTDNDTGHPDDLSEWSLGLHVDANALSKDDIDLLFHFAKDLAAQTGHEFVFGLADRQKKLTEDLCFINADAGERERLLMLTAIAWQ
ncbi:hypothetical protein G4G28_22630 [Massilia sp. Dwa41.01b]|uniref:hypothetical protein n=1 Tax=unclassified Massilia TaxID=2609279 RepID=UPI0016027E8A|nr:MULTISPECIES: hypothetical protein [unclassified Massilia]QNA90601.1 hypothetical protein G4G28_22630 [Massilia sp. Dwa41.01b]QNA97832.1 hypothetical protein G4G31_01710 [Massilia sp. Se16.2.3]